VPIQHQYEKYPKEYGGMYYEYFGLKKPPFRITPETRLFYSGAERGDILNALIYAVSTGEAITKVVGEVGTGKTMLCRMLELKLPKHIEIAYLPTDGEVKLELRSSETHKDHPALSEATSQIKTLLANYIYADEDLLALGDWVFPNVHPYFHNRLEPETALNVSRP